MKVKELREALAPLPEDALCTINADQFEDAGYFTVGGLDITKTEEGETWATLTPSNVRPEGTLILEEENHNREEPANAAGAVIED